MNRDIPLRPVAAGLLAAVVAASAVAEPRENASVGTVPATTVTLHVNHASPLQLLNLFSEKLGVDLYVPGASTSAFFRHVPVRRVTLKMNHLPFWVAMRRIYKATGISVYDPYVASQKGYGPGFWLTLRHPIPRRGFPYCIRGAFLTAMLRAKREALFPVRPAERYTVLRLGVMVQPPYYIFGYRRHAVQIQQLTDGEGRPMKILNLWGRPDYFIPMPEASSEPWCVKFAIPLTRVLSGRSVVGELKGFLRAYILVSKKTLTFTLHGANAVTEMFNRVNFRLLTWPRPGKGYDVLVVAEAANGRNPAPSTAAWADVRAIRRVLFTLHMYDKAGRQLPMGGGHSGWTFGGGLASFEDFFRYPVGKNGKPLVHDIPCKATLRIPLRVASVRIPFEFKHIRLAEMYAHHRPPAAH